MLHNSVFNFSMNALTLRIITFILFARISIQVYPYVWLLLVSTVMNIRLTPIFAVSFHYLFIDSQREKKVLLVERDRFELSKHYTTDLQSAPFDHLGISRNLTWQLGRGSNSHALQHRSQNPACLSIPPPSYNPIS